MKRIVTFILAAAFAAVTAHAEITVGARGIFGWGIRTALESDYAAADIDRAKTVSYGGAVFAKLPLLEIMHLQAELGVTGHTISADGSDASITYAMIDIPLLLVTDLPFSDSFTLSPFIGLKLGCPLGKILLDDGNDSARFDADAAPLWSAVVGSSAAIAAGAGAVVVDVRFDLAGAALKVTDDGISAAVATPRPLLLSVGYQLPL